jgi:TPR repeat protein
MPLRRSLLCWITQASAGFDEAVAAYQRNDFKTALAEFRPLAEQGNAKAQTLLGFIYELGQALAQQYFSRYSAP